MSEWCPDTGNGVRTGSVLGTSWLPMCPSACYLRKSVDISLHSVRALGVGLLIARQKNATLSGGGTEVQLIRIKFDNRTRYRDDHLYDFIARCAQSERPDLFQSGAPHLKVRVRYGAGEVSGLAPLHSNTFTIWLNKYRLDRRKLAKVINHELAHTRGMTHAQMNGSNLYCWLRGWEQHFAWAQTLPFGEKLSSPPLASREPRLLRFSSVICLLRCTSFFAIAKQNTYSRGVCKSQDSVATKPIRETASVIP
jgi:hypothetical protein